MKGEMTKKIEELTKKLDRTKMMMEIQHRCAKNAEIERIEAMVAEMDSIFSLAEDLQRSYEELLNEDDLTRKTMKPSVTETTERKAAGGEGKGLCNLRIPKWQLTPFAGDIMQFGAFWINMMGGVALRKLSYIAIKVAKKHKPTLNNHKYNTPPDYAYLDELIKKYFPDEIGNFRGVYLVHLYGPVTSGSNKRGYLIRMAESTKSQELSSLIREMGEDYKIYKDCKKQVIQQFYNFLWILYSILLRIFLCNFIKKLLINKYNKQHSKLLNYNVN
ncbi:hypothetical protein D917_01828 [Trichinella nativa]|uniref:Uncharacterized protein n=1 Tax=Trichinella nativa TaxID=6335 RepID=A0A1Y3EPV9_9BILA|nr:hypothetical protein D917_01828 [Trichinella nativa]